MTGRVLRENTPVSMGKLLKIFTNWTETG
jgi:hypothetical protein